MQLRVHPGGKLAGAVRVPGDKSIAHRWLILASTADGHSRLGGLPISLDVRSTAACLALLTTKARPTLDLWARNDPSTVEGRGSTWNVQGKDALDPVLEVEGDGRSGLVPPKHALECGNSGTSMRLLAGLLAGCPWSSVLRGDESLSRRPMERVAAPLRAMGADVRTSDGHAPLTVLGGRLRGARIGLDLPTAQVKGAVLLAGLAADGATTVVEPAPTRDHTERALRALGAPVRIDGLEVTIEPFHHGGFEGVVPGDVSSAAFLIAAAALTGSTITIREVGLNRSRLGFLGVMERMGIVASTRVERHELGEPVGTIEVDAPDRLQATTVRPDELPLVIDEVPVLAALASHATGATWFTGARELRVKESDRLSAVCRGLVSLGGNASAEGDDLVVLGGGLAGGAAAADGDHRMGMSLTIAALAADGSSTIDGIESAEVSFPGFVRTLRQLGARVDASGGPA